VGIIGLPNVGKSTLFKALTKMPVDIAAYPFTTIHPNVGIVRVPDERLDKITQVIKPEKITPTIIEFIDVAGLVKGAHKGEGLGNQFLAQIRNCDAILEVVRTFENPDVENVTGKIDPESDIETIKIELELKDLEIEERKLSSLPFTKAQESKEKENLLSKKPIIYLLNTNGKSQYQTPKVKHLVINLKDELEMSELSDSEKKELGIKSQLDQLILACYNILDLITFFTVVGLKETRAWTLKRGLRVPEAGGVVHTDFKEKFIRAEVINWEKLITAGNWHKARELGWLKIAGKDYIVQDGDVIEFKI
ncbi:MAG: redox-regulated ATPase YchF, partial [bacterium]|nr:redox-regulated ATPase YchF [bacterium]